MEGLYITIGVLIATVLLTVFSVIKPRLNKYRLKLYKIEPKKRTTKPSKKKNAKQGKQVWIRIK